MEEQKQTQELSAGMQAAADSAPELPAAASEPEKKPVRPGHDFDPRTLLPSAQTRQWSRIKKEQKNSPLAHMGKLAKEWLNPMLAVKRRVALSEKILKKLLSLGFVIRTPDERTDQFILLSETAPLMASAPSLTEVISMTCAAWAFFAITLFCKKPNKNGYFFAFDANKKKEVQVALRKDDELLFCFSCPVEGVADLFMPSSPMHIYYEKLWIDRATREQLLAMTCVANLSALAYGILDQRMKEIEEEIAAEQEAEARAAALRESIEAQGTFSAEPLWPENKKDGPAADDPLLVLP